MKEKLLIASAAALSFFALWGCQQQPSAQAPITQTSTAVLQILPSTQQSSSVSLMVLPPKEQTSMEKSSSMETTSSMKKNDTQASSTGV